MESESVQDPEYSAQVSAYRDLLIAADQKSSEAYDKALMTLSGGALGLSLTFVKDLAPTPLEATKWLLGASWLCLTASLTFILFSMLSSQWALRKAIRQVDEGLNSDEKAGGLYSTFTSALNITSGITFLLGVGFLAYFSARNL